MPPTAPKGWDSRMLTNLLSAWDSGTHNLEMLKRRLDLTYRLKDSSYGVDFLASVLVQHERMKEKEEGGGLEDGHCALAGRWGFNVKLMLIVGKCGGSVGF
ncbi:hypothetical protein AJ80_06035 [Polytolypa hystricis UAMH7299]|uniref:Uncharacterized protein n=1 Tax=Polytolypa hystricis (strain UAMH7299) TaxID=1447883 RepID=A0A2B7XY76_POLH7|nr:hypothetical protein AJ80_06035 [Polytolypa hystricis UAMH7299]